MIAEAYDELLNDPVNPPAAAPGGPDADLHPRDRCGDRGGAPRARSLNRRAGDPAPRVASGGDRDRRRGRRRADRDRPDPAVRRVQGAAERGGPGQRRGGAAARRRQRPLPVLGDRGRRVREQADRRGRRQRLHALLVRASRDRDPRHPRALGAVRDPRRARPARLRRAATFFGAPLVAGVKRSRAPEPSPRSARRWRCWSSGSPPRRSTGPGICRRCSGSPWSPRRCSPVRRPSRVPTRARPRASRGARRAAGAGSPAASSCCSSPGSRSAARGCCCSRRTRSTRAGGRRRGDIEAAVSARQRRDRPQPWAAEPRTQLALVYEQAGDSPARVRRSPRRSSARPTTTACACSRLGWRRGR